MTPTRARALMFAVLAAVLSLSTPRDARAQSAQDTQSAQTIAKIVELNKEGIAQYQRRHFDEARKVLREALDLCEASGLARHPVAARTHIHLGIVIIAGYRQREIGARQFSEALQIQPDITLTSGLATPAVQEAFDEVAVAVTPRAAMVAPAAQQAQQADEATPATQQADTPADEAPATAAPATAPASQANPPASQANDDAAPSTTTAAGDDDVPRAERRASARARDDDDDDAAPSLKSRFQVGALLGGGVGWATGMGDVNADTPVPSSFAAAKLGHLELEGGYWLSNELMVSLQGRFQVVSGPTIVEAPNGHTYHPATGATAIFAAGTWSPATGRLRPYLSGAVGGGRIRHVVTIPSLHDCGATRNQTCVDTVGAGPFLAGVGGGLTYDLGEHLALVVALNTQIGAPTFTFNVDLNAGVAFRL
jgi:hypothetical protein